MIDLRCHVLEGTGCGPESFEESLEMCRGAAKAGVRTAVAAVRWEGGAAGPPLPFAEYHEKIRRLSCHVGSLLTLAEGFVLPFDDLLPELAAAYGRKLTLGGNSHLLVSFTSLRAPADEERIWASLGRHGLSVLVAHPECNPALRRDRPKLDLWVARGVSLQIDAASLVGAHGREVRRFALDCLRRYQRSVVVASNARGASANGCSLGRAREFLAKEFGARLADLYSSDAPAAILNSAPALAGPPPEEPKQSLFSLMRSRRLSIKLGDITSN